MSETVFSSRSIKEYPVIYDYLMYLKSLDSDVIPSLLDFNFQETTCNSFTTSHHVLDSLGFCSQLKEYYNYLDKFTQEKLFIESITYRLANLKCSS